jgi:hypothetical protein
MRVALGAWGLGAFAGVRSEARGWRFPRFAKGDLSLPPMSSVHAGMIEPFAFVFSQKVFIDCYQFEFLTDRTRLAAINNTGAYKLSPNVADLLREFEHAGRCSAC